MYARHTLCQSYKRNALLRPLTKDLHMSYNHVHRTRDIGNINMVIDRNIEIRVIKA